jgi:hydrogenase expression/formation protein HypC
MCLAIPAEVIEVLEDQRAKVSVGGVQKVISTSFLDEVGVGDFVLVHVGHALSKIDAEEARKTLELFEEVFASEVEAEKGAGHE